MSAEKPKRKSPRRAYVERREKISKRKTFPDNVVTIAQAQRDLTKLVRRAEKGEIIRLRRFTTLTDIILVNAGVVGILDEDMDEYHLRDEN